MSLLGRLAELIAGPAVPAESLPAPLPPGVTVRRNRLIPAIGGITGRMGGPASAVTLGSTILVHPRVEIDVGLLVHELVHVEQWRQDRLFAVKYVAEWARRGYMGNRYEVEAYERERRFRADMDTTARNP
ncbi:MAG: DUF4157 domain-containing protein [Gemmatimonadetes bacterium]|nr:DUF4157 domain-containing protein [Gemmatimonadota bacterium]